MTEDEVKALLTKNGKSWDAFKDWMDGQTVGLNDDGTTDYYDSDVQRYIRTNGVYKHPEEWD